MRKINIGIIAVVVGLASVTTVTATDYIWDGIGLMSMPSSKWALAANWGGGGFPGSGTPATSTDRAIINNVDDSGNQTVIFSSTDGSTNFLTQSRSIVDLLVDSSANDLDLTLQITGDNLHVTSAVYIQGGDVNHDTATLQIGSTTMFGDLEVRKLILDSSLQDDNVIVNLKGSSILVVSSKTVIRGSVRFKINPDAHMVAGVIIMENGSVIDATVTGGGGVLSSS